MKIYSWNVNGVRAAVKKNFVEEVKLSDAEIYCIQETKAQDDQVLEALTNLKGYHINVTSAVKKGYSGVATFSKAKPISVTYGIGLEEHDSEGRVLCTEFDRFYMVNVYVPNAGAGMKRLDYRKEWDAAFGSYLTGLKNKKPVIVTGDLNVAHQPIDLARPKPNYDKTSGYTQVEIDGITNQINSGFVDGYRMLHPEKIEYSFWSVRFGARARNVGWRVDYFLVDDRLKDKIKESTIHTAIMGSDHCPISIVIDKL
ncbi:MAG: exodeoxyribonuclease III [Saprospiraceae bacterium]